MRTDLNLKNEELLLCKLCRLSFNDENLPVLRSLTKDIRDWTYFTSLARNHGISALVYSNLTKQGLTDNITPEIINNLWNTFITNLARNSAFMSKIAGVLHMLNNQNIKTVLLKGLALELTVYGNSGLRQMTDADILVSAEDSIKSANILMENGFISNPLKSVFYKPLLRYTGKHMPTLTNEGFSVDIHFDLFGSKKHYLTEMIYNNSLETRINGERAFIPDPMMFFLYLVKHLWLHEMNNESQLRLYTDLVVLIEKHRDKIFMPGLTGLCEKAGLNEIMASRLRPMREILEISFPDPINDLIDKWSAPDSVDKFLFFLRSPKDNPSPGRGKLYRYHLSEIPGFHRKLLYLAGDLFPTFEFMKKRYGCSSNLEALLYYPLRLGKLLYLIR